MRAGLAAAVLGLVGGCATTDETLEAAPQSRLVASWDSEGCRKDGHVVVIDLEDDGGAALSAWAPCYLGTVTLDVLHWGVYRGRVFAWTPDEDIRSVSKVRVDVDAPVIYWAVATPR